MLTTPGIIPCVIGNVIGGAIFCGAYYWWMYIFLEPDIKVDGVYYTPLRPRSNPFKRQPAGGDTESGSDSQNQFNPANPDGLGHAWSRTAMAMCTAVDLLLDWICRLVCNSLGSHLNKRLEARDLVTASSRHLPSSRCPLYHILASNAGTVSLYF